MIPQLLSSIGETESLPQSRYALPYSPGALASMIRSGCVLESHRKRYAIDVGPRNRPRYVCPRNLAAQGRAGGQPRTVIVRGWARISCGFEILSRSIDVLASLSKYVLFIVEGKSNAASKMHGSYACLHQNFRSRVILHVLN